MPSRDLEEAKNSNKKKKNRVSCMQMWVHEGYGLSAVEIKLYISINVSKRAGKWRIARRAILNNDLQTHTTTRTQNVPQMQKAGFCTIKSFSAHMNELTLTQTCSPLNGVMPLSRGCLWEEWRVRSISRITVFFSEINSPSHPINPE